MFDRVPFGGTGRIVGDGDGQGERVGQLRLKFGFPGVAAIAVAAASIGQNQNVAGTRIAARTFVLPPMGDGMGGEGGGIVRDTHDKGAAILSDVVNAIGNSHADRVGAKVVVKNATWAAFPATARIAEVADQFALLGIDADDGQVAALEAAAKFGEIFELEIAVRTGVRGDLLVIDAQRIAHLPEQACDGIGADTDAELMQFRGDSGRGAARPTQTGHGIAGGVVLQQTV